MKKPTVNEIPGVQNPVTAYARSRGWYARRMTYLDRRGCPDTWFFKDAVVKIVEFKKAGGKVQAHQIRRHEELRDAGMAVYVIDNVEDGRALFK